MSIRGVTRLTRIIGLVLSVSAVGADSAHAAIKKIVRSV